MEISDNMVKNKVKIAIIIWCENTACNYRTNTEIICRVHPSKASTIVKATKKKQQIQYIVTPT